MCHFAQLQRAQLKLGAVTTQLLTLWSPGNDVKETWNAEKLTEDLKGLKGH
jgi:hypothetical protein